MHIQNWQKHEDKKIIKQPYIYLVFIRREEIISVSQRNKHFGAAL
jgi:hypothetical protein